jgi:hypothetical protein
MCILLPGIAEIIYKKTGYLIILIDMGKFTFVKTRTEIKTGAFIRHTAQQILA